jgi:hypothetical protein
VYLPMTPPKVVSNLWGSVQSVGTITPTLYQPSALKP